MNSKAGALKDRTQAFAVLVVKFSESLPNTLAARRIGQQLIDSGTSVAANYRAACRAGTRPGFVAKLAIVVEEADESGFWLGLLVETGLATEERLAALRKEADELTAIFTASLRTARSRR